MIDKPCNTAGAGTTKLPRIKTKAVGKDARGGHWLSRDIVRQNLEHGAATCARAIEVLRVVHQPGLGVLAKDRRLKKRRCGKPKLAELLAPEQFCHCLDYSLCA